MTDGMHILPCPNCDTGTKLITFIVTSMGIHGVVLGKYSSCDCRLTPVQKDTLIRAARQEAGVV